MEVNFKFQASMDNVQKTLVESTTSQFKSLKENMNLDQNGNTSFKSLNSGVHTDSVLSESGHMESINNSFKELKITLTSEDVEQTGGKTVHIAGTVNSIIAAMDTILVQPTSIDDLLYIGTPLFLSYTNSQNRWRTNYIPLGHIDDILGYIGEPLYAVQIMCTHRHSINIGEQVYYCPGNPNTQLMYVEHSTDNAINTVKHRIRTRTM